MSDDLVEMARLAQHDERMATGALYGDLADRIEELSNCVAVLEAKLAQQDDLVQAAVVAALREAVAAVKKDADNDDISQGAAQWVSDTILDLITPDAQAALDRVVSARFGVVRSEVVRLSAEGKIDSEATERLLAAIRKGGE